jgi:transposase-like protein
MIAEYPVKEINEEITKKRFTQTKFYCLRCGAFDIIKKDNMKFFAERKNYHSRAQYEYANDVETTFFVTSSLYCTRCKHTYFVKILDEGIK